LCSVDRPFAAVVALNEGEKAAYRSYFIAADVDRDGVLDMNEAVSFLRRSGVDNAILGQVLPFLDSVARRLKCGVLLPLRLSNLLLRFFCSSL